MIEKFKTLVWFAKRPTHWAHAFALAARKVQTNRDTLALRQASREWAAHQALTVEEALIKVGLEAGEEALERLDQQTIDAAHERAARSEVKMGGAGDLDLLFAATRRLRATRAIETGVAYGWSSLAILLAMEKHSGGSLVSVDMPYPKLNNEDFVGIVVPDFLRPYWTLLREPDRHGIKKAVGLIGGQVDLVHYDSDKSWQGRHYAFPLLWDALRPGGLFVSDDIQDNLYFRDFVLAKNAPYAVTSSEGKFVGIALKK